MWYVYCGTYSPSLHQSKSVIGYKTWSSSRCIFFFPLSSCYFFPLRFKYFPRTLFSNSLSLNHIHNRLYKWTLYVHHFLVLLLHQSSLESMKIEKEQILFHFLFILPNQTQWTHRWYHLYLHHHQLRHNELKMVAPNVQNPAEVAWNSLSQTITIPKQERWIYYIWGNRTLKSQQNIVVEWQQQPIQSQLKIFIIYIQLCYNMFRLE